MADLKVKTLSRLARWRINGFETSRGVFYCGKHYPSSSTSQKSQPFKMGMWNWHLTVKKNHEELGRLWVLLFPESSDICKEQPPFARFVVSVSIPGPSRKLFTSQANEIEFQTDKEFCWSVECSSKNFTVDVEFLDLKICPLNKDKEVSAIESQDAEDASLWPGDGSKAMQSVVTQSPLRYLSRMFEEAIYFDITINTSDGSLKAHKAILCACSPVFESMFHHNLKEKESSTIYIEDMSLEYCKAFLSCLYGNIKLVDFWKYRLMLLGAANKYGIIDLKDACEESLLEDLSSSNVLERLQKAWLYQSDKLKKGCLMFLFEFGKAYEIKEEMNNFIKQVDGELKIEMFQIVFCFLEKVRDLVFDVTL